MIYLKFFLNFFASLSVWFDLNFEFCIGTQSASTKIVQLEFSDIPCLLCKKSIEKTYLR